MRYRWLSALSFFAAVLPAAIFAMPTPFKPWDDMQIRHSWHTVPANWESLGHPPAGTTINLYIAVKPEQESALIDAFSEGSNPSHPRYGSYLSAEQVAELVMPHPDTRQLIDDWLKYHGIPSSSVSVTHGGGWLTVTDVLVSQANQLLGASYQLYRNSKTSDTIIRTVGYSLPAVLHKHIQTVAPTTYFASKRVTQQAPRKRSAGAAPAQAQSGTGKLVPALASRDDLDEVVPEILKSLYETETYVPLAIAQNKLGVLGLQGQFPSAHDLIVFMGYSVDPARLYTYRITFVTAHGGVNDESDPGMEANTDIQYAAAMSFPTPLVFYSVGGDLAVDAFLAWFAKILDPRQPSIPQTISISYGDYEENLSWEYADNVCNLFMYLGSRGITVLVASGSEGVGPEDCRDGEGNIKFMPEFPASCPWVTTVGGTTGNPEVAADLSGGGFSTGFLTPPYQFNVVDEFIQSLNGLHAGRFNPLGRGYPDIAAQSLNFQIVFDDDDIVAHGTPCAVSTVAGIISLINDARISRGSPALGFLNPWLYGRPNGLYDITSGHNVGCGDDGFTARRGWDPVTGLGTLRFQTLLRNLPPDNYRGIVPNGTQGGL